MVATYVCSDTMLYLCISIQFIAKNLLDLSLPDDSIFGI